MRQCIQARAVRQCIQTRAVGQWIQARAVGQWIQARGTQWIQAIARAVGHYGYRLGLWDTMNTG